MFDTWFKLTGKMTLALTVCVTEKKELGIFISQRFLYQGSNSKSKSKHKARFLPQRLGVHFKIIHYFQSIMSRKQREIHTERERDSNK